jgi:hypothetical protein
VTYLIATAVAALAWAAAVKHTLSRDSHPRPAERREQAGVERCCCTAPPADHLNSKETHQ